MKFEYEDAVYGACGVSSLCGFGTTSIWHEEQHDTKDLPKETRAGCGWVVCGFIDKRPSKEMYDDMTSRYPMVYQSPVRKNKNSRNNFFFCIFDVRSDK